MNEQQFILTLSVNTGVRLRLFFTTNSLFLHFQSTLE